MSSPRFITDSVRGSIVQTFGTLSDTRNWTPLTTVAPSVRFSVFGLEVGQLSYVRPNSRIREELALGVPTRVELPVRTTRRDDRSLGMI